MKIGKQQQQLLEFILQDCYFKYTRELRATGIKQKLPCPQEFSGGWRKYKASGCFTRLGQCFLFLLWHCQSHDNDILYVKNLVKKITISWRDQNLWTFIEETDTDTKKLDQGELSKLGSSEKWQTDAISNIVFAAFLMSHIFHADILHVNIVILIYR